MNYLEERLGRRRIHVGQRISRIADVDPAFAVVVNCTGIEGPRMSPNDHSPMRPGRGVVLTGRSSLPYAVLDADDSETTHQLTYVVPRRVTGTYVVGRLRRPGLETRPPATTRAGRSSSAAPRSIRPSRSTT